MSVGNQLVLEGGGDVESDRENEIAFTEHLIAMLKARPREVVHALNQRLEESGYELKLCTIDVARKLEPHWHPPHDFREGEE